MGRDEAMVMVRGVLDTAAPLAITDLLERLPGGATGAYDEQVRAVVVRVEAGAHLANEVLRVLSESRIMQGGPGTEDAILKYLPERASRPAAWDLLSDEDAICTTCSWGPPPMGSAARLQQEMGRHTDRVHGGRSE